MKVKFTKDFGGYKAGDELETARFSGAELVAMGVAEEVAEKKTAAKPKAKRTAKGA